MDKNKTLKTTKKREIPLNSVNTDYLRQNLEFMQFIKENKCKTKVVKDGRK